MLNSTPVALFVYNRPRHTKRVLEALARCEELERCQIVICCDGPKMPKHAADVAATRDIVRAWAPKFSADVIERQTNLGLAHSIVGGVTRLCAEHGRVIVLEDDLVPTPDFLSFMLAGLDRYAADDRVAQVSGCLLTGTAPHASADGLFLPLATTWGWATWQRAWRLFRWHQQIDPSELERDPAFRARFTLDGAHATERLLQYRLQDKHDTWGVLWSYALAKADQLVLYPAHSLIWNGGFDKSGVHCSGWEEFSPQPPGQFLHRRLSSPIRLPGTTDIDHVTLIATREHFLGPSRSARPSSRLARLQLRIRKHLRLPAR